MTQHDLFNECKDELTDAQEHRKETTPRHSPAMNIPRGQKVADGLPFAHTMSLRDDTLFVTHVSAAQIAMARASARALAINL